jgi:hypothetical protein
MALAHSPSNQQYHGGGNFQRSYPLQNQVVATTNSSLNFEGGTGKFPLNLNLNNRRESYYDAPLTAD